MVEASFLFEFGYEFEMRNAEFTYQSVVETSVRARTIPDLDVTPDPFIHCNQCSKDEM